MGRLTHTVSGSIATVRSPAVAPIESLKVHFSPIQEGTGDPSPSNVRPITGWTGVTGYKSGKNLAHCIGWSAWSLNSVSDNRAIKNTYGTTLNTTDFVGQDGAVVITQTDHPSSEDSSIERQSYRNGYVCIVPDNLKFGRAYNISFKVTNIISNPLNVSISNFKLYSPLGSQYSVALVNDNKICFNNFIYSQNTSRPGCTTIDIRICGMSCTISEFMVCDATDFNYDYEPYSEEIIPVTFPAVGKNLFDKNSTPFQTGKYISDVISGVPQYTTNSNYNVYKIPIKSSTTYTFGPIKGGNGAIWGTMQKAQNIMSRYEFNNGGNEGTTHTFTSYSGDGYLLLSVAINGAYKCDDILQLEEGSSATEYEAFDNTVYGGYVDLVTGDIVAEYGSYIFTGDSADGIAYKNDLTHDGIVHHQFNTKIFDRIVENTSSAYTYSNIARCTGSSYWANDLLFYVGTPSSQVSLYIKESLCEPTAESFNAWLSEHNVHFVYKLATPQLIATLTPQELATFKGYSNFWSNAGDVDVTYQVVESSEMTKERQKIFAGNAPSIHTASGSVANFEMKPGLNRNLKSCKVGFLPVQEGSGDPFPPINQNGSIVGVDNTHNESELSSFKIHFSPIQSGSGDPSPTNVRPITGWTGVTGYKGGKSLLPFLKDSMSTAIDYNGYSGWQSKQYIDKSLKGAKVTYSAYIDATSVASGSGDNCVAIWAQDSNGTYILAESRGNVIQPGNSGWSKVTLIIPVDTDWITFGLTLKTNGAASNPMVELGTEQTSYEAYSAPTSYPVSWESQGTVYGGYVDLVSGEVVRTHGIVDLGALSWNKDSNRSGVFYAYNSGQYINNSEVISDRYKSLNNYVSTSDDKYISAYTSYGGGKLFIRDTDYSAVTVSEFATALSGSLAVYKLQIPVVVTTLTPTQIALATGKSSYWSNADSVTVGTAGNVRPINGWGGVNIHSSGKNLLNVNRPYGTPNPTTLLVPKRIMDTEHCYVGSHPDGYYASYYSSGSVSNGVITASSFPNNSYGLGFPVSIKGGQKYVFNVNSDDGILIGTSYYDRNWNFIKNGGDIYQSMLPNKVLTTPDNAAYILIVFRSATNETYVYTNASFELGENGTSYEPYSGNVYSVEFPVQGKNLLDVSNMTHGSYNIGSIPNILEPNTTYTFSVNGNTSKMYRLFATTEDFNTGVNYAISLNASYINKTSNLSFRTFTTPANIKDYPYLALAGNDSSAGNVPINDIKPQVELGSSATSYEPYDNSIFGGYVNLVTGEVWKTYNNIDLGDYTWNIYGSGSTKFFYITGFSKDKESGRIICASYPSNGITTANTNEGISANGNVIRFRWSEYSNYTVSELKAVLTGVNTVYELATPQLVTTLTPTQIQALKGTNNILSDANGIIEVKYWSH